MQTPHVVKGLNNVVQRFTVEAQKGPLPNRTRRYYYGHELIWFTTQVDRSDKYFVARSTRTLINENSKKDSYLKEGRKIMNFNIWVVKKSWGILFWVKNKFTEKLNKLIIQKFPLDQ